MEIKRGSIVRSAAGRDKGDFQVVMGLSGGYVEVCDGKHRPLENMKRKKIKHIYVTSKVLEEDELKSNRSIKKALRPFIEKEVGNTEGGALFVERGYDRV